MKEFKVLPTNEDFRALSTNQIEFIAYSMEKDREEFERAKRGGVADADVTASYPNSNAVFNTSRETTEKELIDIEGVSEKDRRMQGINLCGGWTNSVEITMELFGLPNLFSLDKMFKENR